MRCPALAKRFHTKDGDTPRWGGGANKFLPGAGAGATASAGDEDKKGLQVVNFDCKPKFVKEYVDLVDPNSIPCVSCSTVAKMFYDRLVTKSNLLPAISMAI